MPAPITVELEERSHHIFIGEKVLENIELLIKKNVHEITSCVLVTSSSIFDLYGTSILEHLSELKIEKILVPDGEAAKSWNVVEALLGDYIEKGLDRKSVVIALGGGSVGDTAGFTASIYLRGIRYIQIPTTLLGQVDSAIGGKTAINHSKGKNLIGSFYQPTLIICDTSVLKTLPLRELRSGLAEVIKYGVISDPDLITLLENKGSFILKADKKLMTQIVKKCVLIKAKLVEEDEKDSKGKRAILNYGHTLGHVIETLSNHEINHGEAISIGMLAASKISENLGYLKYNDFERQENLLKSLGLPIKLPKLNYNELISVMKRDKKTEAGSINFILPTGIGKTPIIKPVPEDTILKVLEL